MGRASQMRRRVRRAKGRPHSRHVTCWLSRGSHNSASFRLRVTLSSLCAISLSLSLSRCYATASAHTTQRRPLRALSQLQHSTTHTHTASDVKIRSGRQRTASATVQATDQWPSGRAPWHTCSPPPVDVSRIEEGLLTTCVSVSDSPPV